MTQRTPSEIELEALNFLDRQQCNFCEAESRLEARFGVTKQEANYLLILWLANPQARDLIYV